MALDSLRQHKVRSLLTVLGVVIGIMAIVAVAAIMVGLDRDIRGFLDQYGTDTLFAFRFDFSFRGNLTQEERTRRPLTYEDALAIREQCRDVKDITVELSARIEPGRPFSQVPARYKGNEVYGIQYTGALPSYEWVYNAHPERGRFFNDAEELHRVDVAVIGHDLAEGLFHNEEPLDKTIRVGGASYRVIGVLEKRKGQFFKDESADKVVVVPHRTYRKHNPQDDEYFLGAQAYPGRKSAAEDEIIGLLRRRRNVAFDKPNNFSVSSSEEIARQFRQITGAIAIAVVVISSVGLLVGGVGVMNIMLMSVTERTREIGVRKAMGARRRDIIRQFLTEAIALTGTGGIVGVLLGAAISFAVNKLLPNLPSAVPLWAVVMGVGTSVSVGVFFGIYPALKASRLDPVEALRYE
jgi:ABC-type antimicrobial peptide transport system permease subunit